MRVSKPLAEGGKRVKACAGRRGSEVWMRPSGQTRRRSSVEGTHSSRVKRGGVVDILIKGGGEGHSLCRNKKAEGEMLPAVSRTRASSPGKGLRMWSGGETGIQIKSY